MRERSSGPTSNTLARTGWPCSPNRSQNTTGNSSVSYSKPSSLARLTKASLRSPGAPMPDRSPLMSAANTGTPAREKPSAIVCKVTVLPVPVAPVTRPWRLPKARVSISGLSLLPTKILPSVSGLDIKCSCGHDAKTPAFANAASIIGPRRIVGERFGTTVTMWRLQPGNASPFIESKAVSPMERDQFVSAAPVFRGAEGLMRAEFGGTCVVSLQHLMAF